MIEINSMHGFIVTVTIEVRRCLVLTFVHKNSKLLTKVVMIKLRLA